MTIVAHQAGALGVPMKVHTQKGIGTPVTASMDAYEKLQQVKAEAGTLSQEDADELIAGLDLRIDKLGERVDQGKATLEGMKSVDGDRIYWDITFSTVYTTDGTAYGRTPARDLALIWTDATP